ncbi:pyridoxal phosphate-dependent transferase [Mrakia frigida]|uniref:pyridoxal phosphate-dependent transferase n=1 Tax=Mrakia frigida TaxID=29902 RepID=UPI003FCC1F29
MDNGFSPRRMDLPKALDMSHHLSTLSTSRRPSPLKSLIRYMGDSSIRSLAGGLPNSKFFPFETLSSLTLDPAIYAPSGVPVPKPKSWIATLFDKGLQFIETPKYASNPRELQLSTALQYGGGGGSAELIAFLKEWTLMVIPPSYSDFDIILNCGSTDGFHKIVELLCEKGDGILCEAYTYPSALETGWPMGVRPVPVAMDDFGMIPEALEELLAGWDDVKEGRRRPRVMYTITIGQNPTGTVLPDDRRRAIYKLASKYDIIIVEDDPYFALNFGTYGVDAPGSEEENDPKASEQKRNEVFINALGRSYLKEDHEGRVIRIDTFSKTIAPGCRLGWTTSNALFTERLLRASETSTQQPSGPTQVLVINLIVKTWGMGGWLRWLRGLRGEYGRRRDWMISSLIKGLDVEVRPSQLAYNVFSSTSAPAPRLIAYAKPTASSLADEQWNEKVSVYNSSSKGKGKKIVSFLPPTAGMFVWIDVHLDAHPSLNGRSDVASESYKEDANEVMHRLFVALAEAKVLVAPGWMFVGDGLMAGAPKEEDMASTSSSSGLQSDASVGHFRLAFATLDEKPMKETIAAFCVVVKEFFA